MITLETQGAWYFLFFRSKGVQEIQQSHFLPRARTPTLLTQSFTPIFSLCSVWPRGAQTESSRHSCIVHKNNPDFYSFIWLVHKTQSHVIHGPDPSPNKSNGKTPADSVVLDRPCRGKRINFKGSSLIHSLFLLPQIILLKITGLLLRVKHAE